MNEERWKEIKASKDALRRKLTVLPIAEKIKILEELNKRERILILSRTRKETNRKLNGGDKN